MTPRARNPGLDTLRAVAIAAVVVTHLFPPSFATVGPKLRAVLDLGVRGVDLFFVLSGYLVGGIAIREIQRQGTLKVPAFWARRWFRTLPAYYVVLALYALKQLLPHSSAGLVKPVSYLFFWQTYALHDLPDFAHSWSLCVEEHFYLVLPILLVAVAAYRRSPKVMLWTVATFGVAMLAIRSGLNVADIATNDRYSIWRTDGLCVGVALASWEAIDRERAQLLLSRHRTALTIVAFALTVIGLALVLANSVLWQPVIALGCGAWVALAAGRSPTLDAIGRVRAVSLTAAISYSLYLLHPLVLSTLQRLNLLRHSTLTLAGYIVLGVSLSFAVAHASYTLVEQRFLRLRDRVSPETASPSNATATTAAKSSNG